MAIKINANSYLLFSELQNIDGVEFWEMPEFPELLPQDDDLFVTIGKGERGQFVSSEDSLRIDILSNRIYGTPHLWWILALRNNFEVVPTAFKLNETIIAPSPRYVFQEYLVKGKK